MGTLIRYTIIIQILNDVRVAEKKAAHEKAHVNC